MNFLLRFPITDQTLEQWVVAWSGTVDAEACGDRRVHLPPTIWEGTWYIGYIGNVPIFCIVFPLFKMTLLSLQYHENIHKKYVLSNSESVQCNFFNRMIFHWDMAIYRFSKWRPSAILELFYHHTRPPTKSPLLAAAACQISCQSDRPTQIWRYMYSHLNFSHIWLEMPIGPKIGFCGTLDPWVWLFIIETPQKAHPCVNPLSTVKIRWGVWPVGELTKSVTDTDTQVNLYSVHA